MASRRTGTKKTKSTESSTRTKSSKGSKTKRSKTQKAKSAMPRRIFAQASPHSVGGMSMFECGHQINSETVANFSSESAVINRAVEKLQNAGFEILQVTDSTINIAGSQKTFEAAFNTKLMAEERVAIKELGKEEEATFIDCPSTDIPGLISVSGSTFSDVLEGVAIEEPRYFMAPSPYAPLKEYWHLRVPGDVSLGCNADRAHRGGITGKGIRVAMVDSGWYKHPFFVKRGYRAAPVVLGPGASNPLKDESGHGTGESANIFSNAPDVELLAVKINFVNSKGAFDAAVALNPDIITNSWGSSTNGPLSAANQALAASVAAAVASGMIVVFSAGNGHAGFPGQHPDVISAGGVFMHPDESLEASNYASGFLSKIYPNRRVPDVSGLVGMQPRAAYIMLPLEPGDDIDTGSAGGTHPNGDETASNDGWAAFSGTSAAAPQLAGVAALVKQACPKLNPAQVRNILMKTARDVTNGQCNRVSGTPVFPQGHQASPGPDLATGHGLVDAHKAVLRAKISCLPILPPRPPQPIAPIRPVRPIQPVVGPTPVRPIRPVVGPTPVRPIRPVVGPTPIRPISPVQPTIRPIITTPRAASEQEACHSEEHDQSHEEMHSSSFTPDDIEALQQMAQSGEIDLEDMNS